MWQDFLAAIAIALVLEGIAPFLNPEGVRRALALLCQLNDSTLRFGGLTIMVAGVLLLSIVR